MHRRVVLGGVATLVGVPLAGCLGDNSDGDHVTVNGTDVPLVPVDEAVEWHGDGETLFLDARPRGYEDMHIEGAEHSEYPDGFSDDPTDGIDEDTRIVTYCVCPHAQSSRRAASLIEEGFTEVYALDEGLEGWYEADYPVEGTSSQPTGHY